MKQSLGFLWRWSWLITLPATLSFLHWGLVSWDRYSDFGVRHPQVHRFSLWNVGRMEAAHMVRQARRTVTSAPLGRHFAGLPGTRTVSLYVPEASLSQLDSRLPASGFEYVDGGLWDGGRIREVQVRYRGDNVYHWGYYKKSWRLKTEKETLYDGMRRFNLLTPITQEIANNHLSYRLGAELGVISPRTEIVNVTVNGKARGIHHLVEQLSELTLRRHRLMPGDLYSGELVARDAYEGVHNRLFESEGLWEKVAVNNHYEETSRAPLAELVRLVRSPQTEEVQEALGTLLDMEAFGRFNALEILLSTAHIDALHNWRLYFDPARSVFVPVLWDPVGWHPNLRPKEGQRARLDVVTSPLHLALYRNGDFLRARHEALEAFFRSGQDRRFLEEVDDVISKLATAVDRDPNLVGVVDVVTPSQARAAMGELRAVIRRVFEDVRAGYLEGDGRVFYAQREDYRVFQIGVSGRRPVKRIEITFGKPLESLVSAKLRFWRDNRSVERDVSGTLTWMGTRIALQLPLLARFSPRIETMVPGQVSWNGVEVQRGYYELELDGVGEGDRVLEVRVDRGGDRLEPALRTYELAREPLEGMHAVVHERPVREPQVVQGELTVDGILEMDHDVILMPGTALRLGPGASVVFRGRVWALGSAEKPIRIVPARQDQEPWATVALQGPAASGSVFRHCEFAGGSGLKGDLFEYSGMLSIHDVQDVTVGHCRFQDSKLVDDMVHAVYSTVSFTDCVFEGALFDAVDLDICEGIVERCEFRNSGNDGLDLMTSRVVVLDTLLEGNRDKGISVGEDTRLLAIGCRFEGNAIGVESKDRSVAVLYNTDLVGNGLALNAYDKNWQYEGGGFTYLYKGRMVGNAQMIEARRGSGIWVYDTYMDRPLDPEIRRVKLDETVDADPDLPARVRTLWRYPAERQRMDGFADGYWALANPSSRGSAGIGR